jgi:hypothetical protein
VNQSFEELKSRRQKQREELDKKISKSPREQRVKEMKANPKTNPTLKDIYDNQLIFMERQSEIFDLLKQNTK